MEFFDRSEEYSATDDEEEEALSFCDLVAERETLDKNGISEWERTLRDSNTGSEDFDFEFGRSISAQYSCPADDLFHQGCLLPLTVQRSRSESDAKISCSSKANENRIMLNEKLQAWRIDALDSQRMDFTEKNSQRGDAAAAPSGKPKSKSKVNRSSSKAAAMAAGKSSLKWQFFTLGLMKTPAMKLEDMRLRQGKTNNGCENSLKRSVSCNREEFFLPEKEAMAAKFPPKSKSVKENIWTEEPQPRSKGWKILAPLTSLNGCKVYSNSVINCSTAAKKRADGRGLAENRSGAAKKPPLYADQNSLNFGSRFSKTAAFTKVGRGGGDVSRDRSMLSDSINGSRVEFHRLSTYAMATCV